MRVTLDTHKYSRTVHLFLNTMNSHERDDISNRSVACILADNSHEDKDESSLDVSASWASPMQELGRWKGLLT